MIAAAGGLELVDVEIHGDRGACVAHLPVHSDGVEAALGEAPGPGGPGAHARPRARGGRPRYTPLETLIEVGPGGRPPYGVRSARSTARATSTRDATPSLRKVLRRWVSTVFELRKSSAAI